MQLYGSPRITSDVDVVAGALPSSLTPKKPLSFGGMIYETPAKIDVDWIVRSDEYRQLYEEALDNAVMTDRGFAVVTPEYLAAMKLAAGRPKDEYDLTFLLSEKGLVNRALAIDIVRRNVGGRFAVDQFKSFIDEADWRASRPQ